jgi:hypothetical protein
MRRFSAGVLIGLLLMSLFSAPWMYHAWAVGNCSVFRSWNTGDTVTAGDLNSSFTTAAVTNSTPQCVDDYSSTVSQMQTATDPYASGTESQATSLAGELERLRFMFKQIFGLTQWYRHDQAPTFSFSHMSAQALHLGSTGAPGGTDTQQNQFLSRFPVLTGPNHWTGIWWPHNTTHMALSIADYNHAQGGVQGGIELFRFHGAGMIFHHTVAIMFKHSESQMHGGQRGHITALSVDPTTDQIIVGHAGATLRFAGTGLSGLGGTSKALFLSTAGHVYANTVTTTGGGSAVVQLSPLNAVLPSHAAASPILAKHSGTTLTRYALMYSDVNHQWAHWTAAMPSGATSMVLELYSEQGAATAGFIGWHVEAKAVGNGQNPNTVSSTMFTFYPSTVAGTAGQLQKQSETLSALLDSTKILYLSIRRINTGSSAVLSQNGFTYATEHTALRFGVLRFQ